MLLRVLRYPRSLIGIAGVCALLGVLVLTPREEFVALHAGPGRGDTALAWDQETVGQTFVPRRDGVSAVAVAVAPLPQSDRIVEVQLRRRGDRELLRRLVGPVRQFQTEDGTALRFEFPPLFGIRDVPLVFTLAAPGVPEERAIPLRYEISSGLSPDGERLVNQRARPGDLGLTVSARGGWAESWRERLLVGRAGLWLAGIAVSTLALLVLPDVLPARATAQHQPLRSGAGQTPHDSSRRRRLLLFGSLALALLYALPLSAHLGFWAADESDWAEATTTIAATRATIAAGQLPEWNPYVCGGTPNIANPQTYLLPVALPLSFLVGDVVATKLEFIVVISLGLLGMLKLAHILGLRGAPAVLTSAVYLLSGFLTAHLANGQVLWLTLAWVPWVIYAFLKSLTGTFWWTVAAAAFLVLIFVEGRVYLVAYTALLLVILSGTIAVRDRRIRPLRSLAMIGVLTLALGAWKLLPALSFLGDTEHSLPNTPGLPLAAVGDAFLSRDLTPNVEATFNGVPFARHEMAAYVGVLPLFLALLSLRRRTRSIALPFLIAGLLFLFLSLQGGDTAFLEYLPLARELRNPARMLSMVVFALAILSGLGLSTIDVRPLRLLGMRSRRFLPVLATTLVVADLLLVSWTPLRALFQVPPQVIEGLGRDFFQTKLPERQPSNGYPTVAAGKGAKDFCPAVLQAFRPQRSVRAREDGSYRGEVYAVGTAQLADVTITPNIITARVEAKSADTVVVNQNFAQGWTAWPHLARNEGGLIGVDVPAGSSTLTLRYRTPYLRPGAAISSATVLALGALWLRRRNRRPANAS